MKVDTMRFIDRYAGIPLCFLSRMFFAIVSVFHRKKEQALKNVLFIELSEMGSAILADPALRRMRDNGRTNLHFAIFDSNKMSLDLLRTIPEDNIVTLRSDNLAHLAMDVVKFMLWCRRRQIDTVVDLELFSRFTALLSRFSGASRRCGFDACHDEGLYRGKMLTHPVRYNPHHHISRNFMALVDTLLADRADQPYCPSHYHDRDIALARAKCPQSQKDKVRDKLKTLYESYQPDYHRLVLINPNASELLPQRRWSATSYADVIRQLLARHDDILVIITGALAERAGAELLKQNVGNDRCLNSAGVFAFNELVPLYYLSSVMLTNDSGPAHFASVTPLKTFVIFGPETPELYRALGDSTPIYAGLACSPCVSAANHRKTGCRDNACLRAIKPEQVTKQLNQYLEKDRIPLLASA